MYANYVARNIKKICKEIGPRPSGSDKELAAQEWMANDLKTSCDEVKTESFKLAPAAFMSWVQLMVCCGVTAAVLLFLTHFIPALAIVFTAIGTAVLTVGIFFTIMEFLLYKEALDVFLPKRESHNVIAVRKSSGETKRRIIFSGHADSAPEWRFTYWGGPKLVIPSIGLGLGGALFVTVANIVSLVMVIRGTSADQSKIIWILSIISICFVPIFLFCLLFYNPKRPVEGVTGEGLTALNPLNRQKVLDLLSKYGIYDNRVVLWGTGTPLREFLWSEDMADASVHVLLNVSFSDIIGQEKYSSVHYGATAGGVVDRNHSSGRGGAIPSLGEIRNCHINVGTGKELTIAALADLVKQTVGYQGTIEFDASKPDGTMRKLIDVSKLHSLGWTHKVEIEDGVKKLFEWYEN